MNKDQLLQIIEEIVRLAEDFHTAGDNSNNYIQARIIRLCQDIQIDFQTQEALERLENG